MKLHFHLINAIITCLHAVFVDRRYADKAVEFALKGHPKWGSRDRRMFAEAVYEIVRHWRWYWHLAGFPDAQHADPKAITREHLWHVWPAYWIMQEGELPFFDEVTGVRRGVIVERSKAADIPVTMRESIPDWLDRRATSELGAVWPPIRATLNQPADVYLRVNTLKTDRRSLKERLAQEGFITEALKPIPTALRMKQRYNVFGMAEFKEGLFEVQDAASQMIAPLLEVSPGMRVIDGCAGAGGKTLHLAALMQNKGKILALDVHDWKLAELRRRAARAGVDIAETRVIESTKTIKRLAAHADRLLLDVPCSGLGVLRRNPDAKWKLSETEIDRLIAEQQDLLTRYSAMVKPGGKLVYATCSILPSENEKQIQRFLENNGGAWELEHELKLNPAETGYDGFYAARLRKADAPATPEVTSVSEGS